MVFFTCGACGESLKKAQVDKHVSMCRGCQVLSCIDCGQDFWGDDYKNHLRCISEDQKYGGRGFEAKANKGDVKQQQWLQKVHAALSKPGVSASLKNVLQQVAAYDNVPRKKSKFENWMKNSLKISNCSLHQQVWDILSAEREPPQKDSATAEAPSTEAPSTEAPSTEAQSTEAASTEAVSADADDNSSETKKLNIHERKEARRQKNGLKTSKDPDQDQGLDTEDQNQDQALTEANDTSSEKKKLNKRERKEARRQKNGLKNGLKTSQSPDPDQGQDQDQGVEVKRKRKHREEQNGTKSKKAKNEPEPEPDSDPEETPAQPKGKFNWKGNIKALLRDAPDNELSVKKLRKKVLSAFYNFAPDGEHKSEEQVLALFNKKINKNPKLRILKDRAKLIK